MTPLGSRTTADTVAQHVADHNALHAFYDTYGAIAAKTANYAMVAADTTILASGAITITLPAAGAAVTGKRFTVKNIGTLTVTVAPASGTVDGSPTYSLAVQYSALDVVNDGTNWFVV